MYRPVRNAILFLFAVLAPLAGVLFLGFGSRGCHPWPSDRGHWEQSPDPFTPEPPSPHPVLDPWDASVPPPPSPGTKPRPIDPNARKPSQVIGDFRFYCPFQVQSLSSPDGKLLACSPGRRFVVLFDMETGLEVGKLHAPHDYGIGRLEFSPDSKRLHSGQCVWDVAARRGLAPPYSPKDWSLTADGKTLATLEQVGVKWIGSGPVPDVYVVRPVVRVRDTENWKET